MAKKNNMKRARRFMIAGNTEIKCGLLCEVWWGRIWF